MNHNLNAMGRGRSKMNQFRKKNQKIVNIQRPLNKIPGKKTVAPSSSTSSALRWGAASRSNVNSSTILNSSSRSYTTDSTDSKIILALSHGRGDATCEVGLALINVSKPLLILCQISDTPSYVNTLRKINIFSPTEILVPMTFMSNSLASNRLLDKIKQNFKDTTITAVSRPTFNNITGMQYVKQLCANEWNSVILILQQKYYCLAATAALLNYIETVLFVFYSKQSLKIEYQESEGFAIIDVATADNLELVSSASSIYNKKASLFGILNYCRTKIGSCTLRANILQPPCMVMDIEARLNCISEILHDSNALTGIQLALTNLKNVDQLLTIPTISFEYQETCSERQLNYILTLNSILENINPLKDIMATFSEQFFVDFHKTLSNSNFVVIRKLIHLLIHTDARPGKGNQGTIQRCFAVKPGVNALLDIVRKSYSERVDDMREYVKELAGKYNLPLTLSNNCKKGYHIVLALNQQTKKSFKKSDLPPEFIQVERLATSVTMKTLRLLNFTVRVEDIQIEVIKLSNVMIHQLFVELRAYMGLFYQLCEEVAKLDMLQSLAQASCIASYTRPEFKDYTDLVDARHPLLDILRETEPTSNSIFVSKYKNIHIITGPNSSGKSIFIRQLLLLQVMAQIGSFVPATKAVFKPCDRILARVQFDDKMECNASTFVLEIKEMQYFRTILTDNTLIIIDELCRSTAVGEGTAMAVALCEDLAKTQAHCFFATHFIFMTNVADVYPNVQNWQMETLEENHKNSIKLNYTYRLIRGVTTTKRYGLFAATKSWPKIITDDAKRIFGNIQEATISSGTKKMQEAFRLKYDLEMELKLLKLRGMLTCTEVNAILSEYLERLKELGYNLEDDNNIQLTVNSKNNSPRNMPNQNNSGLNINLESSVNISSINNYCEVVYSQTNLSSSLSKQNVFNLSQIVNSPNLSIIQKDEDPDVTLAIQEAQEMSSYFIDGPEQDAFQQKDSQQFLSFLNDSEPKPFHFDTQIKSEHLDNNSFENFVKDLDPDVSMAIQEAQEVSQCFMDPNDEWNAIRENEVNQDVGGKRVLIKSVHIFDAFNNLVDVQIHPPPRNQGLEEKNRVVNEDHQGMYCSDMHQQDIFCPKTHHQEMHCPKTHQQEIHFPDIHQEEIHFPDVHQQEIHFPDIHQQEIHFPDIHQQDIHFPDIHQQKIHFPDIHQQEIHCPKTQQQEIHCLKTHQQEMECPDIHQQEIHFPNVHHDEIYCPDIHQDMHCLNIHNQEIHSPDLHQQSQLYNKTTNDKNQTLNLFSEMISTNTQDMNTQKHKNIFESSPNSDIFQIDDTSPKKISPILTSKDSSKNSTKTSSNSKKSFFSTPSTLPWKRKRATFKTPLKQQGLMTFKPPKPLSKQEILKNQREIMQKYMECNSEEEAVKNMELLMNMPSVSQLRHQQYVARVQRTQDGIVVAVPVASPKRKQKQPIPLKTRISSENFDKTLLSDKNSQKFIDFLESKKDDGFMFNFGSQPQSSNPFVSKSETPEGYYKNNKSGINDLYSKYL
ncbi:mutS protein homolog 4-like [Onthophagus taurus]|uniref:mutS protein homolog 4-like n=1 Tax=Onthophagus taurus TaxID=166361 RepID=UPI0039BE090C